jgi:hypothetical protein
MKSRDMHAFNGEHADALRRLWFCGDVHGEFSYLSRTLLDSPTKPSWIIFLGDVDIDHKPFHEVLEPLHRNLPLVKVAFIHGNHDADTYEHWSMLHDCADAVALHDQVMFLDMAGVSDQDRIRLAGLGGNFLGRVWSPPGKVVFRNKASAMNRGPYQWRNGQRPYPSLNGAIYPDDVEYLSTLRADILVTHEAPSCHPHGFAAIDQLARDMHVVRTFHGHQHDDRSEEYALTRDTLGFDAQAVGFCAIKNGLGEHVFAGPKGC